jgi:hypothetical protein
MKKSTQGLDEKFNNLDNKFSTEKESGKKWESWK